MTYSAQELLMLAADHNAHASDLIRQARTLLAAQPTTATPPKPKKKRMTKVMAARVLAYAHANPDTIGREIAARFNLDEDRVAEVMMGKLT